VLDLITSRPQDYNLIIEFSKAGAEYADLITTLEFLASNNYPASALELIRGLFKAQTIFSKEISQQTKAEWLTLLNSYIQAGCSVSEAAAMLDLLAGKSNNKQMQDYFNANQAIKNEPKKFANLLACTTQLDLEMANYECTAATKTKIINYLKS